MGKTTTDDAMEIFKKQKWEQFLSLTSSLLEEDEETEETMKKFWSIEVKQRKTGNTEGSFDAYYSFNSNDAGEKKKKKKFRSLKEVERYMREEERGAKKKTTKTTTTLPIVTTTKKKETPPTEQIQERKTAGVTTTTTGKSGGGGGGGDGSRFVKDKTAFKNALDDEEENDDDDEDDEPVLPSALGFGTGRAAKVLANNGSALRRQGQRQHQRRQSAFLPSRSHLHNSTSNNSNGAKTHSRLHNSFVANSPRLTATTTAVVNHDDDTNDDDDNRRRRRSATTMTTTTTTKRNENGKKREETRGQDWRLSNPSDELFDKKRDAFLNKDPEVALERRMLKERFIDKNNSDINNDKCQTKEKEKQGRREKNALPSKYEHLALVFNGLNMYRELLRMRNSAETVENICACAQQLVKRDVRFEHLRKIETVRPGTFSFTKKKRDAIDQNHRQEGRTFIDPKSVRLEILEERTQRECPEEEEEEEEEVKSNAEDNGVLKKREKSSHLMSEKERERARNADFLSRLMRLCDEAHLAFCQRHGIAISPSSNVPEQPLWHETFDVEREAPDIAECAVRDAPPLVPSVGGVSRITATAAAAMMTTMTTTPVPTSMSIQSPKPPPSTPSSAFPLTPLNTTTTTTTTTTRKKKVITERDIDEEIRRMQMDDGGNGKDEVSRQAIRRVLERKFEKEIHNSPSAVAHRAESKIKQNLPRIFDLVHSLFATSRKRAFAFDVLLHKTHEQINAKDTGGMFYSRDEIEDCLRTLAKTCSEWCKIERAQDGEELFRVLAGSFSSHSSSQPSSSSSSFAPFSGAGAARGRGRHLFGKTQYLPPPPSSSLRRSAPPPTSITTTTTTTTMNERDVSSPSTKKRPFSSSSPIAKKVKQKLLMDAGLLGKIDGFGNNGLAAA